MATFMGVRVPTGPGSTGVTICWGTQIVHVQVLSCFPYQSVIPLVIPPYGELTVLVGCRCSCKCYYCTKCGCVICFHTPLAGPASIILLGQPGLECGEEKGMKQSTFGVLAIFCLNILSYVCQSFGWLLPTVLFSMQTTDMLLLGSFHKGHYSIEADKSQKLKMFSE